MKQELTELARAVDRLAAAIESLKEAEKENPPCTPLKEKVRLAMDVAHFHDHYTSNGWKISGRAPMKDWRAAMRNWARREKTVRPLTAYERKRAEFELEAEAIAARKEAARRAAIAALTERDWALCREACRNCGASGGCLAGVAVPSDHRLNARPCPPEECPYFAKEGGGAMSFRNDRFNARCLSLDRLAESVAPAKVRIFSDHGEGAERIYRAVDREDELEAERELELSNERLEMLLLCKWFLNICGEDRLVPVLEQVVANGANRQESIWRLSRSWRMKKHVARVKYHQGVRDLLTFFSPNEIKGETHF